MKPELPSFRWVQSPSRLQTSPGQSWTPQCALHAVVHSGGSESSLSKLSQGVPACMRMCSRLENVPPPLYRQPSSWMCITIL
jgi:hypothetical protein